MRERGPSAAPVGREGNTGNSLGAEHPFRQSPASGWHRPAVRARSAPGAGRSSGAPPPARFLATSPKTAGGGELRFVPPGRASCTRLVLQPPLRGRPLSPAPSPLVPRGEGENFAA